MTKHSFLTPFFIAMAGFAFSFANVAAARPTSQLLGPAHPTKEFYDIGKERLKLKAFVIDGDSVREIRDGVEFYRRTPGTHNWEARIGYHDLNATKRQSLVLSWYNLDSSEVGWTALTVDSGRWLQMTHRTEKWDAMVSRNIEEHASTNGTGIYTRLSKVNARRAAFAFSQSSF